jgi:predicted nucleotidyltransferase
MADTLGVSSGLGDQVISKIRGVFAQFPEISEVVLFGSRAKGTYRAGSDIDLALIGNSNQLTSDLVFRLSEQLEALMLPYTFDLVRLHTVDNPDLLAHIKRVGVPLAVAICDRSG